VERRSRSKTEDELLHDAHAVHDLQEGHIHAATKRHQQEVDASGGHLHFALEKDAGEEKKSGGARFADAAAD